MERQGDRDFLSGKGKEGLLFRRRRFNNVNYEDEGVSGVLVLWEEERKSSLWWDCWVIFVEEQSYEEKKIRGEVLSTVLSNIRDLSISLTF